MERRSNVKTLAERQNCLTTKDTKSTKDSEHNRDVEVKPCMACSRRYPRACSFVA